MTSPETQEHAHRWVIDNHNHGACKVCGVEKDFKPKTETFKEVHNGLARLAAEIKQAKEPPPPRSPVFEPKPAHVRTAEALEVITLRIQGASTADIEEATGYKQKFIADRERYFAELFARTIPDFHRSMHLGIQEAVIKGRLDPSTLLKREEPSIIPDASRKLAIDYGSGISIALIARSLHTSEKRVSSDIRNLRDIHGLQNSYQFATWVGWDRLWSLEGRRKPR